MWGLGAATLDIAQSEHATFVDARWPGRRSSLNQHSGRGVLCRVVRISNPLSTLQKTCGDDKLVAEMIRETEVADWHWVASFNTRVMNPPDSDYGVVADPVWDQFGIMLLPKKSAPTMFILLRPTAILLASAKLWSRRFFLILGEYDAG